MLNPAEPLPAVGAASPPKARFRWVALGLCAATMFTEGFDAQLMGYVVPGIAQDWGVVPSALTSAIVVGLLGLMLGAFFVAPLADSYGRRRVVLFSVGIFGVLTVATAFVDSLPALVVMRLLTGFGLGGAMPNAVAITAEFSPPAKRTTAVAIMFSSFSVGAGFGGAVAGYWLLPNYGWPAVFVFCGAIAVLLMPLLIAFMPESYVPKVAKKTIPLDRLFSDGRALITLLLWVVFFSTILELYFLTSWLPTTLKEQGLTVEQGVYATAIVQFAGVVVSFLLGPLVDRFGPQFVLPAASLIAAASIAGIGLAGSSPGLAMVLAAGTGIGTVGAQNCSNGVAAKFYPTAIRATGVGWALAVGRIGSIVGSATGGILLATGVETRVIFLVLAVPPLAAAAAYLAMGRPESLAGETA
jgi:MFS transporter, AAHS family, 4-hydroxybenzoate transporter